MFLFSIFCYRYVSKNHELLTMVLMFVLEKPFAMKSECAVIQQCSALTEKKKNRSIIKARRRSKRQMIGFTKMTASEYIQMYCQFQVPTENTAGCRVSTRHQLKVARAH